MPTEIMNREKRCAVSDANSCDSPTDTGPWHGGGVMGLDPFERSDALFTKVIRSLDSLEKCLREALSLLGEDTSGWCDGCKTFTPRGRPCHCTATKDPDCICCEPGSNRVECPSHPYEPSTEDTEGEL